MGVDPMINMNDFYAELDQLYEKSNYEAAEKLMVANLKTARDQKDVNSQLPILNEYMALLRSRDRHPEMLALIPEADAVIETLSIQHTAAAAATYINIAEGARSAMQYNIAERFYRKAASPLQLKIRTSPQFSPPRASGSGRLPGGGAPRRRGQGRASCPARER